MMIVYTVHEPQEPAKSLRERAEDIVFVKEGFTWFGFLVPPLWLLLNRLWIELLAMLLLGAIIVAAFAYFEARETGPFFAWLTMALIVGFEGNDMKRWRLERMDYHFLASVAGRDTESCERRFFDAWLPHAAEPSLPFRGRASVELKPSSGAGGDWQGPTIIGTLPGAVG